MPLGLTQFLGLSLLYRLKMVVLRGQAEKHVQFVCRAKIRLS